MSEPKQIREFLASLPEVEQREAVSYLLTKLLGDAVNANENLAVHREDGTLIGYIRPLPPPTPEVATTMSERGSRVDPRAGRSTSQLLDRMKAGDEEGVRRFLKNESKRSI